MYDQLMQFVFDWCVRFLVWWANAWGITYEELNVWLFVILHPLVTAVLALACLALWRRRSSHAEA
jgi:hypothetical protein